MYFVGKTHSDDLNYRRVPQNKTMSVTEVPEVVAPVEVPSPAAAAVEEEPAKRVVVKRFPKPDQSLLKAEVEKLKDQISQNQQRQDAIRDELEKRRNGRVSSPEQQNIKTRLMELRSQFQALLVRSAKHQFPAACLYSSRLVANLPLDNQ